MEGDRIKIIEGPLKDYEGVIKKVNKHRRSAMVEMKVGEHIKNVWMSFQWFNAPQQMKNKAEKAERRFGFLFGWNCYESITDKRG